MLDAYGEHQGAATSVLCNLTCGIGVAFHKGHETGGGEGRVLYRGSFGADMREVVAHAAAAFHELHLLLVDLYNAAVGVGLAFQSYHEAV